MRGRPWPLQRGHCSRRPAWIVSATQQSRTEKQDLNEGRDSTLLNGPHTIGRPLKDCGWWPAALRSGHKRRSENRLMVRTDVVRKDRGGVVKINIAARLRASRQYKGVDLTGRRGSFTRSSLLFVFLQAISRASSDKAQKSLTRFNKGPPRW